MCLHWDLFRRPAGNQHQRFTCCSRPCFRPSTNTGNKQPNVLQIPPTTSSRSSCLFLSSFLYYKSYVILPIGPRGTRQEEACLPFFYRFARGGPPGGPEGDPGEGFCERRHSSHFAAVENPGATGRRAVPHPLNKICLVEANDARPSVWSARVRGQVMGCTRRLPPARLSGQEGSKEGAADRYFLGQVCS